MTNLITDLKSEPNPDVTAAAALLDAHPAYRVLRSLNASNCLAVDVPAGECTGIGAVVDVETTGLDPRRDLIIELAVQRFRFTDTGLITKIEEPRVWREDPGFPLDAKIRQLTGLSDADLAGKSINDTEAMKLLVPAEVIIAHNARFDVGFVEARLPMIKGREWACSMTEVDWGARSLDGKALGHLLMQCGYFHEAHQAAADVLAVLHLMAHVAPDGTTALAELVDRASQPTVRISVPYSFDIKDKLRKRGYRFDGNGAWCLEIADVGVEAEQIWLHEIGYRGVPQFNKITWLERHR